MPAKTLKPYFIWGITLCIAGIIFSPWIFSEQLKGYQSIIIVPPRMPASPPITSISITTQQMGIFSEPSAPKNPIPSAWMVQIGNYSDKKKATHIQNQLLDKGFLAATRMITTKKTVIYRVVVGPVLKHEQAQDLKIALHKNLQLNGIITRFDPTVVSWG